MNDSKRFFFSAATGIAVVVAITALYSLEGRPPDNRLVYASAAMAVVAVWYFLGRNRKS
jgi:hypothetical protein